MPIKVQQVYMSSSLMLSIVHRIKSASFIIEEAYYWKAYIKPLFKFWYCLHRDGILNQIKSIRFKISFGVTPRLAFVMSLGKRVLQRRKDCVSKAPLIVVVIIDNCFFGCKVFGKWNVRGTNRIEFEHPDVTMDYTRKHEPRFVSNEARMESQYAIGENS